MLIRDGLPIIGPGEGGYVKGALIRFANMNAAEEAYRRIANLEPDRHYLWKEAQANGIVVNVLFGRSPSKGSVYCDEPEWNGSDDPLLTSALDVVQETLQAHQDFVWDLKPLFRLQMAYLLLWSSIERYVSLRYHFGDKVTEKVNHLASERAFREGLSSLVTGRRELYRADQPEKKVVLDPQAPEESLAYYYQVRSNITHRGKGVTRDHDLVLNAANEQLAIFRGVLKAERCEAEKMI